MSRHRALLTSLAILSAAFLLPMAALRFTVEPPRMKRVHMDLFRYGMVPSVIHASRGDTLVLTFSSRDTPQSFFLQEYDLDVKVSPNTGEVEVVHPSDWEGEPVTRREVVIEAGRGGPAGWFNTRARYRGHVYSGPMHGFEQGFLIVHPNYLHAGVLGLLCGIPLVGWLEFRRRGAVRGGGNPGTAAAARREAAAAASAAGDAGSGAARWGIDLLERWPRLRSILSVQGLQFWLMILAGVLMYAVILINLLGTKMAGGNLGILLVWVVWLFALVVVLVPLFGRAWCTLCPIPMIGDAFQRGTAVGVRTGSTGITNNAYNGMNWRWPRALAGVVPRTIAFLCFGTISVLVISQPRWTGWALVLLVGLGTFLPLVFEQRAFCRFLCPINSFISLYARMGRIALRAKQKSFCDHCVKQEIVTCERGNQHGWACPYGLAVHEIEDNAECGLCMECLRSCHYTNISIYWRRFGPDRLLRGPGEALQASVMLTLAVAYAILFQGPWHQLRDMVDLVDKKNWDLFAYYAVALWLLALVLVPFTIRGLAALGGRIAAARDPLRILYPRTASTLVPMGLFLWIAFAIPMLQIQGSFVLSTLSDPFGWGWDLFGTAGYPWTQLWPASIPWIQSAMVLLGFAFALSTAFRAWSACVPSQRQALLGLLPIGAFLFLLSAGMLWFFTA